MSTRGDIYSPVPHNFDSCLTLSAQQQSEISNIQESFITPTHVPLLHSSSSYYTTRERYMHDLNNSSFQLIRPSTNRDSLAPQFHYRQHSSIPHDHAQTQNFNCTSLPPQNNTQCSTRRPTILASTIMNVENNPHTFFHHNVLSTSMPNGALVSPRNRRTTMNPENSVLTSRGSTYSRPVETIRDCTQHAFRTIRNNNSTPTSRSPMISRVESSFRNTLSSFLPSSSLFQNNGVNILTNTAQETVQRHHVSLEPSVNASFNHVQQDSTSSTPSFYVTTRTARDFQNQPRSAVLQTSPFSQFSTFLNGLLPFRNVFSCLFRSQQNNEIMIDDTTEYLPEEIMIESSLVPNISVGIPNEILQMLPLEKHTGNRRTDQNVCLVCQLEYMENEIFRRLPCLHRFHQECIDRWLTTNTSCPICRLCVLENIRYSQLNKYQTEVLNSYHSETVSRPPTTVIRERHPLLLSSILFTDVERRVFSDRTSLGDRHTPSQLNQPFNNIDLSVSITNQTITPPAWVRRSNATTFSRPIRNTFNRNRQSNRSNHFSSPASSVNPRISRRRHSIMQPLAGRRQTVPINSSILPNTRDHLVSTTVVSRTAATDGNNDFCQDRTVAFPSHPLTVHHSYDRYSSCRSENVSTISLETPSVQQIGSLLNEITLSNTAEENIISINESLSPHHDNQLLTINDYPFIINNEKDPNGSQTITDTTASYDSETSTDRLNTRLQTDNESQNSYTEEETFENDLLPNTQEIKPSIQQLNSDIIDLQNSCYCSTTYRLASILARDLRGNTESNSLTSSQNNGVSESIPFTHLDNNVLSDMVIALQVMQNKKVIYLRKES